MFDFLDENFDRARASLTGFGDVETLGASRWRWALGERQTLRFRAGSGAWRLRARVRLSREDLALHVTVEGKRVVSLGWGAGKPQSWAVDLPAGWSEVEFTVVGHRNASAADGRPLAFCVEQLRATEEPAIEEAAMSRPLAQAASGRVPGTFCPLPFTQLFIDGAGDAYPCCDSILDVRDQDGELGPTPVRAAADLARAWNSPLQRRLRRELLLGREPLACRNCYATERGGASSLRKLNAYLHDDALRLAKFVDADGSMSARPSALDIRFGNACNLKCRMCDPRFSSALIPEFEALTGEDHSRFRSLDWFRDPGLLDAVADYCADLTRLLVMGGEATLVPEFVEFLRRLDERGLASKIMLTVVTNGTKLRDEVLGLFPRFRSVELTVSLDGTREVHEYLRYPSKFADIERNLDFLHANADRWNIVSVRFNTAVQANNVFDLPGLCAYLAERYPRFHHVPYCIMVEHPADLAVSVLPADTRRLAREKLEAFVEAERRRGTATRFRELERALGEVARYLETVDTSHLLEDFRRKSAFFDARRGQKNPQPIPGVS